MYVSVSISLSCSTLRDLPAMLRRTACEPEAEPEPATGSQWVDDPTTPWMINGINIDRNVDMMPAFMRLIYPLQMPPQPSHQEASEVEPDVVQPNGMLSEAMDADPEYPVVRLWQSIGPASVWTPLPHRFQYIESHTIAAGVRRRAAQPVPPPPAPPPPPPPPPPAWPPRNDLDLYKEF